MAFFRNILLSNKHDIDMEAANHSDMELDDMEVGSGSVNSDHSGTVSTNNLSHPALDPKSTFSYSFPAPNPGSKSDNHVPPVSMQTTISNTALPLLPPAQIGTSSNTNKNIP